MEMVLYMKALLDCRGDIEIKTGTKQSTLSFCHYYLNYIATHDFNKISLLHGYITDCNFGVICLSETVIFLIS